MNLFEYIKFDIINNKALKYNFIEMVELYKEGMLFLLFGIIGTIFIVLFPITFPIKAILRIRDAKKEVEYNKSKMNG